MSKRWHVPFDGEGAKESKILELVIFLENQYYITFLPFILKSYMRLCSQITFERFFSSLKSIYLQQEEEKKCASSEHSLKWHLQFQDANDRKMP